MIVFQRQRGWRGLLGLRRALRAERFDLVFDLQGLLRSGLMTRWARGGQKVGRADAREGAGWFYDRAIAPPTGPGPHHAVAILAPFLAELGLPVALHGRVTWHRGAIDPAVAAAGGAVVMFPDSRRPEKNWTGFADLTETLLARDPARRVVWAGSTAAPDGDRFPADRFSNLTARTALADLPGLIEGAACVVSNDSGPMHLAAAMGKRVVAVFGPTDPRCFGPYPLAAPTHRVVRAPGGDLKRLEATAVADTVEAMLLSG